MQFSLISHLLLTLVLFHLSGNSVYICVKKINGKYLLNCKSFIFIDKSFEEPTSYAHAPSVQALKQTHNE